MTLGSLSGCNGGSGGSAGQVPTAIYEGSTPFLGVWRSGELLIRSFSNNTIDGTLTVAQDSANPFNNPAGGAPLPPGSYSFTGTVAGSNFTGQGRFLGSPAFSFAVSGQFPATAANIGIVNLSGTSSAGAFNFDIGYYKTSGASGLNSNFTFTGLQNSNANTAPLNNTVGNGSGGTPTAGVVTVFAMFSAIGQTAPTSRSLTIRLNKGSAFQNGDSFPVTPQFTFADPISSQITYSEGNPITKGWSGLSGTAKITAINGHKVTVQLTNVQMQASAIGSQGNPNQGTGSFTVSGTGTFVTDNYALPSTF